MALLHLCECIEDCEHISLAVRMIHFLGVEGPKTTNPAKYIRYVYNRVILENEEIRAAAGKVGKHRIIVSSLIIYLKID